MNYEVELCFNIRREEKNDVSKDFHREEKFEFRGQQRASRLSEKTRELESNYP